MEKIYQNYQTISSRILTAGEGKSLRAPNITLVAASKSQTPEHIERLIACGASHFGENRMQEASRKWVGLKDKYPDIRLHLIGPLQSNKVAEAVALCDVIETVDREKIAALIAKESRSQGKNPACLIQVNIGKEPQKSGVHPEEVADFLEVCRERHRLTIAGLMGVPPAGEPPAPYFALMKTLKDRLGLPELSMGMSGDFETAIAFGATEVRIGTALFGPREPHRPG